MKHDVVADTLVRGRRPFINPFTERCLLIYSRLMAQQATPLKDTQMIESMEDYLATYFPDKKADWDEHMTTMSKKLAWLRRSKKRSDNVSVRFCSSLLHSATPPGNICPVVASLQMQWLDIYGQGLYKTGRSRAEKLAIRRAAVSNMQAYAEFFCLVADDLTLLYGSPENMPPAALAVLDEIKLLGKMSQKNSHVQFTSFAGVPNLIREAIRAGNTHLTGLLGIFGTGSPIKCVHLCINRASPAALVEFSDEPGKKFQTALDGCPPEWRIACTQSGTMTKEVFRGYLKRLYDEMRATVPADTWLYVLFDNAPCHNLLNDRQGIDLTRWMMDHKVGQVWLQCGGTTFRFVLTDVRTMTTSSHRLCLSDVCSHWHREYEPYLGSVRWPGPQRRDAAHYGHDPGWHAFPW